MEDILFLALHVTAVSVSHVPVIALFTNTLVHFAVATKTLLWRVEQWWGWRTLKSQTCRSLDCVSVRLSGLQVPGG